MGAELTPTREQQAIIDAFGRELSSRPSVRRHLIVNAAAGTGKTSTLRMMSAPHRRSSGLYVAFNKSVADSAKDAFGPHVECRTSHSLARRYIANSQYADLLRKIEHGPQRDERQQITKDFGMNQKFIKVEERRNSGLVPRTLGGFQLVSAALGVIERFCQTAAEEPSAAHIVKPKNFVPADFEKYREAVWSCIDTLVHALWADLLDVDGKYMRFSHNTYLKLWSLSKPVLPYDFILLDEAQDTAPVTEAVITRQHEHALLVMVGDPSQAIYGFTGARDSMTRFESSGISHESLTLSESWRFGPEIASAANSLLAQTERSMRITGRGFKEGEVLHHLSSAIDEAPSVYVCRSNFDVIEAALSAISKGHAVDTSSVDLTDVEAFLGGAVELKAGRRTKLGGLGAYSRWSEFELDYEDGVPMTEGQRVGMMLLDKYATEDACKDKIALIRGASGAAREGAIKVTAIHKAKGGEWFDVSVRYDSAFRRVRDEYDEKKLWWEVADPHLAYVAVTRAIETLDPGSLWPLVEYGIVCEPTALLARAKGLAAALSPAEQRALMDATTPEALNSAVSSHFAYWQITLSGLGVRSPETAAQGFVRLIRDVIVAGSRAAKTNGPVAVQEVSPGSTADDRVLTEQSALIS